jgi:Membrane dipeptidase (Peptidase family M19)
MNPFQKTRRYMEAANSTRRTRAPGSAVAAEGDSESRRAGGRSLRCKSCPSPECNGTCRRGGIIGSWPSGLGLSSFADYIDAILRLVDAAGIDHTAIGTDMDANFKPVLRSYRDWSLIPAALLARGMREDEVAKVMGGNFMRIFRANLGQRQQGSQAALPSAWENS